MTEYGRLFFSAKSEPEVREELEADYRKVALVVDGLSPMEVVDLGPAYGVPRYRCWAWYATSRPKEASL